jgi:hypothetical protein
MFQSKFHAFDTEVTAVMGLRDGAVYSLPPASLAYGELVATSEHATEPTPLALDRDVRREIGFADDGRELPAHVANAVEAARAVPAAKATPLAAFYRVADAHREAVIDLMRAWGCPWSAIEKHMGAPVDRSVRRLVKPCSLAGEADALEHAAREASEKEAERARAVAEAADTINDAPCPEGEYWLVYQEADAYAPGYNEPIHGRPAYIDPDGAHWHRHDLVPGVTCGLRTSAKRAVVRPGDPLPIPRRCLCALKVPMTSEDYQEHRRALARALRGQPTKPRPDAPSLRYRDAGSELITEHARHLLSPVTGPYGYKLGYLVEALVRGLGLPPMTAVEAIEAGIVQAAGGTRPWTAPERSTIERMAVDAYDSAAPEAMPWLALAPKGVVDVAAEKVASWGKALRRWLAGRDRATSGEIVAALKESGADVDEARPADHQAILRIATEAGWQKKRIQNNGEREIAFVRQ